MSELKKSDIDKLLQSINKIPPYVKGTPIDRNEFVIEFAEESYFENFDTDDYRMVAVELFNLLEDIEQAEKITDDASLRSIVKELTSKRFIYLSQEKADEFNKMGRSKNEKRED